MERDHVQQHLYYYELIPIYYIWMIHGESSMFVFSYEYGNSCSSSMNDNLDFRRKKYNVVGPHYEALSEYLQGHDFIDEQLNLDTKAFYDLLRQEDQELL